MWAFFRGCTGHCRFRVDLSNTMDGRIQSIGTNVDHSLQVGSLGSRQTLTHIVSSHCRHHGPSPANWDLTHLSNSDPVKIIVVDINQ